jgi:hypothetical protein
MFDRYADTACNFNGSSRNPISRHLGIGTRYGMPDVPLLCDVYFAESRQLYTEKETQSPTSQSQSQYKCVGEIRIGYVDMRRK